jgi:large subunit ribosomal protein L22
MTYKHAFKDYNQETMARAVAVSVSISTKHCIEISNRLRGKKLSTAKRILNDAVDMKKAISFTRFNKGLGHKKAVGPGRFVVKAAGEVLRLLESCEANAQQKGLNTNSLKIIHINTNYASRPWHYGRQRRRRTKRSHIEVVMQEMEPVTKKQKNDKKETKPEGKPMVEKKAEMKQVKSTETEKSKTEKTPEKKTETKKPKTDTVTEAKKDIENKTKTPADEKNKKSDAEEKTETNKPKAGESK